MDGEEEEDEDWTPEKDAKRDPGKLMEKYMKILEEKILPSMERSDARSAFSEVASIHPQGQIEIRRIRNGFLMTYFEAREQLAPPGVASVRIFYPEQVEVFIKNHAEGAEHLKAALMNAELLAKSAEAIREAQRRQVQMFRVGPGAAPYLGPAAPPRTVFPPAVAEASPDEDTRKLDQPPAAPPPA